MNTAKALAKVEAHQSKGWLAVALSAGWLAGQSLGVGWGWG